MCSVQALSEKLGNHSATYWVPYLRTHLIYNLSPLLSEQFLNATFKLDADLEGMEARPPRWKKCVGAVKHALPGLTDEVGHSPHEYLYLIVSLRGR